MSKIIAGNWKMNLSPGEAETLVGQICRRASSVKQSIVILFPQALLIPQTLKQINNARIFVGSQNISEHESGAYTGENSPVLVQQAGCQYTLIGHSERRTLYHESDTITAGKLKKALELKLGVIYCVGESLEEREKGNQANVIKNQLTYLLETVKSTSINSALHIAYEPVWAIGTGKTASVDQAAEIHTLIRKVLDTELDKQDSQKMKILYGGSAKKSNAKELLSAPNIDGLLIGGASLTEEFIQIINISEEL